MPPIVRAKGRLPHSHSAGAGPIFRHVVVACRVPGPKVEPALPIKGGAVLRTIKCAADYMLTLPHRHVEANNGWRHAATLIFAEDIYLSFEPGGKADGQEFNALVGKLLVGNKGCPTRDAPDMHTQAREARPCVVKWNGTKFVYKPL
jgi:hypothetical protein